VGLRYEHSRRRVNVSAAVLILKCLIWVLITLPPHASKAQDLKIPHHGSPLSTHSSAQSGGVGILNFNKDIAPIIFNNCTFCHHPGDVGPFPLLTYQDVQKRAQLISVVTQRRYMPPWKPEQGYGEFRDVRRLTDMEIETIKRWVEEGCVEGRPEDLPPAPRYTEGWHLGEPDLVLEMPRAYDVPAEGPEFYRCFAVPTGLKENKYVVAFEVRPSNRKVVHHAFLVPDPYGAGRRLDSKPGDGYPCSGGFGFLAPAPLGVWTAGTMPRRVPEGMAVLLKNGSSVVIQIHFRPQGKPEREQTSVGLYFAQQPPKRVPTDLAVSTFDVDIPPGAQNYKVRSFSYLANDEEVLAIFAHAHYLAKEVRATATLPDGTLKRLLWINDWDFNWQEQYWYAAPLELPRGTRVDMEFTFDNSADNPRNPSRPPKRVTWGQLTTDEMAEIHLQVIAPMSKSDIPGAGSQKW
jgi:hypothetical protein